MAHTTSSAPSPTQIKPGDFCQSNFYFRVFTKQSIEEIRKRDALLANATSTLDSAVGDAAESSLPPGAMRASTATANGVYASIKESLMTSGEAMLPSFVKLLTSGSMPQLGSGTTAQAEIPKTYTVTVYNDPDTSGLTISGLEMTIYKPAEYYIQPVSGGIAGPLIGPFKVDP